MTLIKYTCLVVQRHMTLSTKRDKTAEEMQELNWLDYKLKLVRNAQRK